MRPFSCLCSFSSRCDWPSCHKYEVCTFLIDGVKVWIAMSHLKKKAIPNYPPLSQGEGHIIKQSLISGESLNNLAGTGLILCHYIAHIHSEIVKNSHISMTDTKLPFCHQDCTACYYIDVQRWQWWYISGESCECAQLTPLCAGSVIISKHLWIITAPWLKPSLSIKSSFIPLISRTTIFHSDCLAWNFISVLFFPLDLSLFIVQLFKKQNSCDPHG